MTSEIKLDFSDQKLNIRVASQVVERRKTWDLRKLENFKKISKFKAGKGHCPVSFPKIKIWQ